MTSSLFARYYRAHQGRWRGRFRFVITDEGALRAAAIPGIDRARIRTMARICRVLGFAWIETRVDCDVLGDGRVLHETRIARAGFPLLVGREVLTPRPDGRSGTMTIEHRFAPFGARSWDDGEVVIGDHAAGAVYDLPWIGGRIQQRTRVVPDGLALEQEGPFSCADFALVPIQG